MSARRLALIAVLIIVVALMAWRWQAGGAAATEHGHGPTAVELTQVRRGSAPVQLSAVGNVVSPHTVNVRAQVPGTLKHIFFTEGAHVEAGDKLFQIDPAPYEAALAQARAQLAIDRASLAAARAQYQRMKPLIDKQYVTAQEYDNARATADEGAARLLADQANIKTAEINLGYTLIRAPIAGRTGSVSAKTGNLVGSSDALPLVVLNEVDTVQIQFAIPQDQLPAVQQSLAKGELPVQVYGDDPTHVLAQGHLVFIENTVDTSTGTVTLKAEVNNHEHALWPGAFVSVGLTLSVEPDALLVPETAVQPGADGQYVFVVDADHRAQLRTIVVDRQVGADVVVANGLNEGETIIARSPHNLQPGTEVISADKARAQAQKSAAQP